MMLTTRRHLSSGLCLLKFILPCRSSVLTRMDRCTKFKIFNVTLIFCVFNFFLYRFFAYPGANPFLLTSKSTQEAVSPGGAGPGTRQGTGLASTFLRSSGGRLTSGQDFGVQNTKGSKDTDKKIIIKDKPEPPRNNSKKPATATASDTTKAKPSTAGPKSADRKVPTTPEPPLSNNLKPPKEKNASRNATDTDKKPSAGEKRNGSLPLCPVLPPDLIGPLATYTDTVSFEKIAESNPLVKPGGRYKPADCVARHRVAIVIPYRNREQHLKILLHNLHPMLQRQQLDYGIFVIEEELPTRFNRAMLMNIGFVEAIKRYDYQCAIFHDVDLIPENDRNVYSCPQMPRHLSAAIDKFQYRLPYAAIYGGVSAMTKEHMRKVNGFSNLFFGWGGEDDDMAARIKAKGLKISRYPMSVARYRMIKHSSKESGNEPNPQR